MHPVILRGLNIDVNKSLFSDASIQCDRRRCGCGDKMVERLPNTVNFDLCIGKLRNDLPRTKFLIEYLSMRINSTFDY